MATEQEIRAHTDEVMDAMLGCIRRNDCLLYTSDAADE